MRLPLAVALCLAGHAHAMGGPPAACGTLAVAVERAEAHRTSGAYAEALEATRGIPIDFLPVECRTYVRALRAELLIYLAREPEARAIYAEVLDEVPSWRPDRDATERDVRRVFGAARAQWVKSNAGPLRITPPGVSLLSPARDVGSSTQPLLIQAMQQGEISWHLRTESAWIQLSRSAGTTTGGRDTVVVSARPRSPVPPDTTFHGSLVFEAPPWPDVPVDVSWRIMAPAVQAAALPERRRRRVIWIGLGAVIALGIVGAFAY